MRSEKGGTEQKGRQQRDLEEQYEVLDFIGSNPTIRTSKHNEDCPTEGMIEGA